MILIFQPSNKSQHKYQSFRSIYFTMWPHQSSVDNAHSFKMASLIPKNGTLFNYADTAPAPSKDFCQVVVTIEEVIFRWWKVTIRKTDKVAPGETRESHQDFIDDDRLQAEILRTFGKHVLNYILGLVEGHIDFLSRLSNPLLLQIVRHLELEDIARLSQTAKQFRDLCVSDELWEAIYEDHSETSITEELRSLAEAVGWQKLFFTNKLQLQVQLRRQAKIREGQAFLTE